MWVELRDDRRNWRTVEHDTHVEYQSMIKDVVTESEYLGGGAAQVADSAGSAATR